MQTAAVSADVLGGLRQTTQVVSELFSRSLDERSLNILGDYQHLLTFYAHLFIVQTSAQLSLFG